MTTRPVRIQPERKERNMTIASEASNFQKKKVMATGMAFWTENTVTAARAIKKRTIEITLLPL